MAHEPMIPSGGSFEPDFDLLTAVVGVDLELELILLVHRSEGFPEVLDIELLLDFLQDLRTQGLEDRLGKRERHGHRDLFLVGVAVVHPGLDEAGLVVEAKLGQAVKAGATILARYEGESSDQ